MPQTLEPEEQPGLAPSLLCTMGSGGTDHQYPCGTVICSISELVKIDAMRLECVMAMYRLSVLSLPVVNETPLTVEIDNLWNDHTFTAFLILSGTDGGPSERNHLGL